jgi:histidinol-phosphate/aromatic aminotransferase/cobyric acid decarboxylase-like protein
MSSTLSRRSFLGGITAAVGCLASEAPLIARAQGVVRQPRPRMGLEEYDAAAKLAYNENPYGPPDAVMKAMTTAFKYDNRYGYPDGNLLQELAKHHGVPTDPSCSEPAPVRFSRSSDGRSSVAGERWSA